MTANGSPRSDEFFVIVATGLATVRLGAAGGRQYCGSSARPVAYSCQPSRDDYEKLIRRGDQFAVIQCDRVAFRSTTRASTWHRPCTIAHRAARGTHPVGRALLHDSHSVESRTTLAELKSDNHRLARDRTRTCAIFRSSACSYAICARTRAIQRREHGRRSSL